MFRLEVHSRHSRPLASLVTPQAGRKHERGPDGIPGPGLDPGPRDAAVRVGLLWACCRPREPDGTAFWWGLSYFLICAYPVLVWRLDEAVVLGGALYLVLGPWGEGRPLAAGVLAGALLPGHLWLLPA